VPKAKPIGRPRRTNTPTKAAEKDRQVKVAQRGKPRPRKPQADCRHAHQDDRRRSVLQAGALHQLRDCDQQHQEGADADRRTR